MSTTLDQDQATSTPPRAALIAAREVHKTFLVGKESVEILHGVSLAVAAGEMVAVMGPSGSGKSTLMYCLAGLEQATSGSVHVAGKDVTALSRTQLAVMRRTDVGFVFQAYNLVPTLTAAQNVALPWTLAGRKAPAGLVESTLESVGLGHRITARPVSMSGGEQQRVALARVLAQQPQVIFADEPTGALDTRSGQLVLAELQRAAHEPGRCALVVTHDPSVAAACDRVVFLRDGVLVAELVRPDVDAVAAQLAALTQTEA